MKTFVVKTTYPCSLLLRECLVSIVFFICMYTRAWASKTSCIDVCMYVCMYVSTYLMEHENANDNEIVRQGEVPITAKHGRKPHHDSKQNSYKYSHWVGLHPEVQRRRTSNKPTTAEGEEWLQLYCQTYKHNSNEYTTIRMLLKWSVYISRLPFVQPFPMLGWN